MSRTRNLTVRLDEKTFKEVERAAEHDKSDKSTVARKLLTIGIQEVKKIQALDMYREGKCSLWKAAQMSGIPLREMIELAEERRVPLRISPKDVDDAWGQALNE